MVAEAALDLRSHLLWQVYIPRARTVTWIWKLEIMFCVGNYSALFSG